MREVTFVILAYSRPARLRMVINSINNFIEKPRILVYVDKAKTDSSPDVILAQDEVIAECKDSVDAGLIEDYRVSALNQGTKISYFESFKLGFLTTDNVVLLEDDMILIADPSKFIDSCIKVFESEKNVGMAVLFANFNHRSVQASRQITNWPIMWGVLLNKKKYSSICNYLDRADEDLVTKVVSQFAKKELKGFVQSIFRTRFEQTWRFKYSRALNSRTAWDTAWQFALWGLNLKTLVPARSLIADLGIDQFSVSTTREKNQPTSCRSIFRHIIGSNYFCRACESFREVENYSLPVMLRKNRFINFLLLRGLL